MKTLLSVLSIVCLLFTASAFSQSEEDMKVWMEYMTPGEMHKNLAESAGDWTFEGKFWMDPADEPTVSTGTTHGEMLLGGRYLQQKHSGNMMGMPFEGINTVGYDNARKIFISTWIDNMGTGIMMSEGTYNEADNSINFIGKSFDPLSNTNVTFRQVVKFLENGTQLLEMYISEEGQEFKNMEILYTKK